MGLLTIDVETQGLLKALSDFAGPVMEKHSLNAAGVTAERVAAEQRTRVRRRTGKTAAGIEVARARTGLGYVVRATRPDGPGVPGWLEHGTQHMTKKEFFDVAARLEEGAHDRRMRDAIHDAIDEVGLGD